MDCEKLFYIKNYNVCFSADVLECLEENGTYAVTLNRTLFYPEGGGQPCDTGVLGRVRVLDVKEKGGRIFHYTDKPLNTGSSVTGEIDWDRRFSFMQNHTGEHIVSGIIKKYFNLNNVGFHMGAEFMTIDTDGELKDDDIFKIEQLANKAVYANIPVVAGFPTSDRLERLNYRSKKALDGDIRIVEIDGYDACACCGLHVKQTGEVGLIKLVTAQKYKSGTRIFMLCGEKAFDDYVLKNKQAYEISALLSAKPTLIAAATEKLQNDNAALKLENNILKDKLFKLRADMVEKNTPLALFFEDSLSPDELRRFCTCLCECAGIAAVFSGSAENGYKYAIGSHKHDAQALGKRLNQALSGKGGGKNPIVQGTVAASTEEISEFWRRLNV